jgi:urea transporter
VLARGLASASSPEKKEEDQGRPNNKQWEEVQKFAERSATGVGQVIFLNSHVSGGVIMGGLALADPFLATLATLGTVTATATAKGVGLNSGALNDGLWGYNGCLVGCAAAVFVPGSTMAATTFTVLGAAATPLVAASLNETVTTIPQWTFAFNIVTLSSLLRSRPLLPMSPSETTTVATYYSFGDYILAPLTGISQIFVVESALSGAVILGGISIYSQGLAAHALAGSAIGTLAGAFLAADSSEIAMGLWGFNSALTSMAVGTFFVHGTPAMMLSAGGAAATAVLFGAMKTVFGAYGAPCLTLPFCFTMSACYVLHKQIPGLVLAKSPHSPEKNVV